MTGQEPLAVGLTTHDLLAMLANGTAVTLADGTLFVIDDDKARLALSYFLLDPGGKEFMKTPAERGSKDMAGLVRWMAGGKLPEKPAATGSAKDKPLWTLTSLAVRQFGGLQPFCAKDGSDAPDITIDITRPVFLAQGINGAGKSSLARALSFLLTGKVASNPDYQHFAEGDQLNTYTLDDGTTVMLPTIVPMPTWAQWEARVTKGLDSVVTSVTGVFNAEGGKKTTICRKVVKLGKSYTTILEQDGAKVTGGFESALGITPLAVELSALHMGRLAHLQLGRRESLADGVRALTGLREVGALAEKTAPKIQEYLKGPYFKTLRNQSSEAAANFTQQINTLKQAFAEAVLPPVPPLPQGDGKACRDGLAALGKDLDDRAAKVKQAVAEAAGVPEDSVVLEGLDDKLVLAAAATTLPTLNSDGVANLVAAAAEISADDIAAVRMILATTASRANDFAAAQHEKLKTRRRRHYARIADGLLEEGAEPCPDGCPTCLRGLDDSVRDDVLGMPVAKAIAAGAEESADIRWTIGQFVDAVRDEMREQLPEAVAKCLDAVAGLSAEPMGVQWAMSIGQNADAKFAAYAALTAFQAKAKQTLSAGAANTQSCEESAPPFVDPLLAGTVEKRLAILTRLLEVVHWAQSTATARAQLVTAAYGIVDDEAAIPQTSLRGMITGLRSVLKDYAPVKIAKLVLDAMKSDSDAWLRAKADEDATVAAAEAVGKLADLKRVVDVQVGGLFSALKTDMERYWKLFYQAPGHAGPQPDLVTHDGNALQVLAEMEGVRGSAHNITNSSQIRALLFTFVLALLKSVWKRDGGLRLVLLDDPQLLFDADNQTNLAKGLVTCSGEGFRPLVLTFDRVFTARVARAGDCRIEAPLSDKVERHQIVPRGVTYACVRLKLDVLTLNTRRAEWSDDRADGAKITAFCRDARAFIEHTLVDLLTEAAEPVFDHPTLQPLGDRVRRLVKQAGVVQNAEPFHSLLALLPDGAPEKSGLNEALNWSAHFQGSDDLRQRHATAVDSMLDSFLDLRDQCLDILTNRVVPLPLPKPANTDMPVGGAPAPAGKVKVIGLLAASEGVSGPDMDADGGPGQSLVIDPDTRQAFGLGGASAWLPYPLNPASMIICERALRKPAKGEFVVVADRSNGQTRIGWCHLDGDGRQLLLAGLGGAFIDSFEAARCDVFRVVGAVFDGGATEKVPCHPLDKPDALKTLTLAAEISEGDSAEPLIRKGDFVLLREEEASATAVLAAPVDSIFAVQLADKRWIVKRVSGPAGKPYRHLLPLGTRGSGEIATADKLDYGMVIERAFPVAGFLRR